MPYRFRTVPGMPEGTQKGCAAATVENDDSTTPAESERSVPISE
ncbi:MAG TPA: hypothetical protein PLV70_10880 [Flavobacteriales bacterium]|nr:hypothetical protein [Flavobacteriales bacterium]HRP81137.1 hypothetical protein [Flavobacteriales bacterium]HRQ85607.1 hypothetical protein [Flavobacteriales bacterium]